jgi:hypothetical protein
MSSCGSSGAVWWGEERTYGAGKKGWNGDDLALVVRKKGREGDGRLPRG